MSVPFTLFVLGLPIFFWAYLAFSIEFFLNPEQLAKIAWFLIGPIGYLVADKYAEHLRVYFKSLTFLLLLSGLGLGATMVATAAGLPYLDATFLSADRSIGFEWTTVVQTIGQNQILSEILARSYEIFDFSMPAAFLIVTIWSTEEHIHRLTLIYFILLNITAFGALVAPCVSVPPFLSLPGQIGFVTLEIPHRSAVVVESLRNGGHRDFPELIGVVTMPSFHVAGTTVFVWAVWPIIKRTVGRIVLLTLAALVILSAVPFGGHYVVDLLAGFAVTVAAIMLTGHVRQSTLFQKLKNPPSRLTASRQVSSEPANDSRM